MICQKKEGGITLLGASVGLIGPVFGESRGGRRVVRRNPDCGPLGFQGWWCRTRWTSPVCLLQKEEWVEGVRDGWRSLPQLNLAPSALQRTLSHNHCPSATSLHNSRSQDRKREERVHSHLRYHHHHHHRHHCHHHELLDFLYNLFNLLRTELVFPPPSCIQIY